MATKYKRAGSGNYSADASWSTTSGGSADTVKPTAADDVIFDSNSGDCTLDAASLAKTVVTTGYIGTFTWNAFSWTVSGSVLFVAGMTLNALATSTLIINATATLTTGGKLLPLVSHTSGTLTLGDDLNTLASKSITVTLSGTAVDLNGHKILGNSITNRVFINSSVIGTAKTLLNCLSTSFANADFRDITFTSASDLNLSAITGGSGNCLGNTLTGGGSVLTFTPSVDQHWNGTSGGNTSTNAWTTRVPLPQDKVYFDAAFTTSQTVTNDMPRFGKDIDFTGATNNPAFASSINFLTFGSYTLLPGMASSSAVTLGLCGRGSHTVSLPTASVGQTIQILTFGGTYQLLTNVVTGGSFSHLNGTLDWNGKNITCATFVTNVTTTRVITNATGTLTVSSSPTIWALTTTNLTFDPSNLTIVISGAGAAKTFALGGLTYKKIQYNAAGGALTLSGGGTITTLEVQPGVAQTINITSSTTITVGTFRISGSSGKLMTLQAVTGGTFASISKAAGVVSLDYMSIKDIHFVGGATFYAGSHSTDVSGNSGITFTDPPSTGTHIYGDEGLIS